MDFVSLKIITLLVLALGMVRGFYRGFSKTLLSMISLIVVLACSMILTPAPDTNANTLELLNHVFQDIGFARLTYSDPEEHDRIIAFTSQLAHIASSAYVKSPEAQRRRGFSAGSFKDMTRVARLDEDMWTGLFLDDADYLSKELDILIHHLSEYSEALKAQNAEQLRALLKDGREKKATAGGN